MPSSSTLLLMYPHVYRAGWLSLTDSLLLKTLHRLTGATADAQTAVCNENDPAIHGN